MKKTKEQVLAERKARERQRAKERKQTKTETEALRVKQQAERDALKARQAKRRREAATTNAGGKRDGAGRPLSMPHKPTMLDGEDINQRKTMTFYGSQDEKPAVLRFLKIWRELRFKTAPEKANSALLELNAQTMLELMTYGSISDPQQAELLKSLLPNVAELAEKE